MLISRGQQGGSRLGKGMRIVGQLSYHSHAQGMQERATLIFLGLMLCISATLPLHCHLRFPTNKSLSVSGALPHTDVAVWSDQQKEVQRQYCDAQGQCREAAASCFCCLWLHTKTANAHCQIRESTKNNRKQSFTFTHFRSSVSRTFAPFFHIFLFCSV